MNSFFANIGKNIAANLPIPHGNATTVTKRSDLGDTSPPRNYLKLNWDLSTGENMQEGQRPEVKSSTRMRLSGAKCFFHQSTFGPLLESGLTSLLLLIESVIYCRVWIVHSDAICFNRPRLLRNQIWSLRRTVRRNDLMNQNFQFTQWMITCFGFFHEERESKKWGRLNHCVTP